ncbi:hypothetical protein OIDMADRAFT_17039 [Oidiodendron maius Zn]|uniref:Cytochrome c oxidase assembly factor 6 n=1 Tax=Oidiodendron maius (strain Zn) TaxID=913774 RepID=A0A0C3DUU5_OIDMZ|nr:hypothetical protein OIDMADRAFT_17039 [Oidiodendron maius Zn]
MGAGASKPAPKISSDGTPIAPDRTQRSQCWEARDIYYGCLDKHDILDSIAEKDKAARVCAAEGRAFEANCAESWVTYFKKRRIAEYKKNKTLEKLKVEGAQDLR